MALAGGLLLTVDAPLLRLAATDSWTIIAVRGVLSFFALWVFWMMFRRGRRGASPFVNGYLSVLLSCMTALVSIMFVNAIQLTTVANVVFILAFNPMFAALLSWVILGERQSAATLAAIAVTFAGRMHYCLGRYGDRQHRRRPARSGKFNHSGRCADAHSAERNGSVHEPGVWQSASRRRCCSLCKSRQPQCGELGLARAKRPDCHSSVLRPYAPCATLCVCRNCCDVFPSGDRADAGLDVADLWRGPDRQQFDRWCAIIFLTLFLHSIWMLMQSQGRPGLEPNLVRVGAGIDSGGR